ncbi:uncharacterized protein G2W53_013596 [Senna tora]|uniref:Uncharacterized protein n=1 Tax=Senna tora TaxID=362788 RepID=A0A834TZ02_9FABA|nr:uncharacterized protein G2W53_013596 [Senna tora]
MHAGHILLRRPWEKPAPKTPKSASKDKLKRGETPEKCPECGALLNEKKKCLSTGLIMHGTEGLRPQKPD